MRGNQGLKWCVTLVVAASGFGASAEPILPERSASTASVDSPIAETGTYFVPNERNPALAQPVLRDAPAGAYVTVGTVRGFIGAASAPRVTHLFLLDMDPRVVFYNQIEIALLRASANRADYLRLRHFVTFEQWSARLRAAGLSVGMRNIVADRAAFDWWTRNVRDNPQFDGFHAAPPNPLAEFAGANYLHSDTLFNRLRTMAQAGRIETALVNIGSPTEMEPIWTRMAERRIPLSVLDLSNAWWERYLPRSSLNTLLESAQRRAAPEARLVVTGGSPMRGWSYYWVPMAELTPPGAREDFVATMQDREKPMREGQQQRLYRVGNRGGQFTIPDLAPEEAGAACPIPLRQVGALSKALPAAAP